jgi:threonine dehydratase
MKNIKKDILAAENRIRAHLDDTPLLPSQALSREASCHIYLKCENLQPVGAFKVRGALNKLLSLSTHDKANGIVTASSGNHGAAVAYGLQKLKMAGKIFVPENVSSAKLANIKNYHQDVALFATDCMQTELHAIEYAYTHHQTYISPYNDYDVICGQGTISIELLRQLDAIDAVFVPIGGGGLIAGIAGYLKSVSPQTKIIGCMPVNSPVMAESIKAGKIIEMETLPTLSDATAGGIEPGAMTFEMCQAWVDDYVLVSENEIKDAMQKVMVSQRFLVEGASGVAIASAMKTAKHYQNKNVVVILSGGNISMETLRKVVN